MDVTFLGATGTVTGSRYLVRHDAARVLVDCGLFQGYKALRLRNWAPMPFRPGDVAATVLTHAHIDHSGALPLLVRSGFQGPIYCTRATFELCSILLPDSAHLQEEEAEFANRHGYSKHSPALPLYSTADANAALKQFFPCDAGVEFDAAPGIRATFTPSGHILGASHVTLAAGGRTLVFSGDLGRPNDTIMQPPALIEQADHLVLESTYGDRLHLHEDSEAQLGAIVSRTVLRGGVVVVPSFAVGRAQALMVMLHRLRKAGALPAAVKFHLDSPMAADVSSLYVRHQDEHRLDARDCAEMFASTHIVNTPDDSRALDASPWPKVIIAASGMATGGRVLHHLKRFGPDPRNTILFTGYQAGGTRGASLMSGAREIKIHGEKVRIDAEVAMLDGLSAHADWSETLDWLAGFRILPRRIFLTHGEPAAADALRIHIAERFGVAAEVPDYRDSVALD